MLSLTKLFSLAGGLGLLCLFIYLLDTCNVQYMYDSRLIILIAKLLVINYDTVKTNEFFLDMKILGS